MAEARTKISLDSGSFEKGAKAVTNAAQDMASGVKAAFTTAGAAVLLAFGVKGVASLLNTVKETFEFGEAMANAGRKAGLAAGQFYLFNKATEKGIALKTAASLLGKNADVLNRSANLFRDVSIKLWAIGEQIRGFWLGLLERLSPVLSRILDGGLGSALLDAGDKFGAALAKAVEIVYQLAKDGKLWTTIKEGFAIGFDYAGERLIWLGKNMYEVVREVFSDGIFDGIVDALANAWIELKKWADGFEFMFYKAMFSVLTEIAAVLDKMVNKLESAMVFAGLMSQEQADTNKANGAKIIANMRGASGYNPPAPQKDGTFTEKVGKIFERNGFKPSDGLSSRINDFAKTLTDSASKWVSTGAKDPARQFENNLPIKTYGADSLTRIGGGGGVYMGLSVLDVNKQQLKEQRRTNEILMNMGGGPVRDVINQFALPAGKVSRVQKGSGLGFSQGHSS